MEFLQKFSPDTIALICVYLPEMIGALLTSWVLFFLGKKTNEKNDLLYASMGFLVLGLKNVFPIAAVLTFVFTNNRMPAQTLQGATLLFQCAASVLMIVGGFQYFKQFKIVHRDSALFLGLLAIGLSFWVAMYALPGALELLQTAYLVSGLFFLGMFFTFSTTQDLTAHMRPVGLVAFALAVYYLQQLLFVNPNTREPLFFSIGMTSLLYGLMILLLTIITIRSLKNDIDHLQRRVVQNQNQISGIIQISPFPIIISNLKDDHLILSNDKAAQLFGINLNETAKFKTEDYYVDKNDRRELLKKLTTGPVVENYQALFTKPGSDQQFWLEMSARVMDYNNEVALFTAFKDITAQKAHEHELFERAVKDPLTGAYNRRQFQELATKELNRTARSGSSFCLAMLDIDFFKKVNDTYGHDAGDEVLKALAKKCMETLRASDIFARYGGEEFVMILSETDVENGEIAANRLREKIDAMIVHTTGGHDIHFTVSIGLVPSSVSNDLDVLIKCADIAMYMAKEQGRNRVVSYADTSS